MEWRGKDAVEGEWRSLFCSGEEDEGDDEAVETQDFGEDKDEDHADEEAGLLGRPADAGVTDDTDGETGGEAGQADGEASGQMHEAREKRVSLGV